MDMNDSEELAGSIMAFINENGLIQVDIEEGTGYVIWSISAQEQIAAYLAELAGHDMGVVLDGHDGLDEGLIDD